MKKTTILTLTSLTTLLALGATNSVLAETVPKESEADITLIDDTHEDGPLRISKVTNINFGIESISGSDKAYYANYLADDQDAEGQYRSNYTQVTDNRGTNQGWSLQVSNTPFKVKDEELTLDSAQLLLSSTHTKKNNVDIDTQAVLNNDEVDVVADGWTYFEDVKINNSPATVVTAKTNNGMGVNNTYFGEGSDNLSENSKIETKNKSIELRIPGVSSKTKKTYTSTLTWLLTDEPSI